MLSVLNDSVFQQEAMEKVLANLPSDLSIESLPDTANAAYLRRS